MLAPNAGYRNPSLHMICYGSTLKTGIKGEEENVDRGAIPPAICRVVLSSPGHLCCAEKGRQLFPCARADHG